MENEKKTENLQVIKKRLEGSDKRYLLKLNRAKHCLEVFKKVENNKINEYLSIREDFDSSLYVMFEKIKSIACICGGSETPTPYGIFNIEFKSRDSYVSGYHSKFEQVQFWGYMVIFEDYFIHSNMYLMDVEEKNMRGGNADCISIDDEFTAGCIRVNQEELDWLLENIDIGTIIELF